MKLTPRSSSHRSGHGLDELNQLRGLLNLENLILLDFEYIVRPAITLH